MPDFAVVIINAVVSFILLFFVAKILGKKQIAELDFIDYVVGISIGSIVAEWATDTINPWYHYVIAVVIYGVLSISITLLERTTPFIKAFLRGRPIIIIEKGKINYKNLKKSKLDMNDILGMCRSQGYFDISSISYAIFETDGNLSILPTGEQKPLVIADIDKKPAESQLTKFLVIDGMVDENALKVLKKDKTWLFKGLEIKRKKDLNNIILAYFDTQNKKFEIHYKKQKNSSEKA